MYEPRASTSCAARVHCVELHLTFWRLEFRAGSYILKTICVPRLYTKKSTKTENLCSFWAKPINQRWLISNTQIVSTTDKKDSAYKEDEVMEKITQYKKMRVLYHAQDLNTFPLLFLVMLYAFWILIIGSKMSLRNKTPGIDSQRGEIVG